ncbi:conserved hypothetical protein [Rhodococcus sp. RD6.2]|uniref:T3SS (YopN, CesT) and YbjN peptide-binding chaperone 1 n=1 Tax=Rhodococcus sp. RD6.2 TaxID=260936 RepID=UPI00063B5C26|nr:hypothetical protein [Rhodococcus sp. RD6.2]CRK50447.1 conserved hypothetical protein [Rhodococcus sp. RD6.2]
MSDGGEFDRAVDEAWREFRGALADRLAAISGDEVLVVGALSADRESLLVTLEYFLTAERIVCSAQQDALADDHSLFDLVCADGWVEDGRPDRFFLEVPLHQVDRTAAASVTVLREVAGIAHPSFVEARTSDGPLELTRAMSQPPIESDTWEPPDVEFPRDPEELHAAVGRVLAGHFGAAPTTDDDGDFVIALDGFTSYVIPHGGRPQVRILVPLLQDVTGLTRASEVLTELNSRYAFIRLTLASDQVNAIIDLPASPFSGVHLCDHLDLMEDFLQRLDERFAERLGGRYCKHTAADDDSAPVPEGSETDDDTGLPPSLLTLIQLDASGAGALDPDEVAEVCGHDRDAILDYLRICEEQEIAWNRSADDASAADNRDEFDICMHEAGAWQRTVGALRAALRIVTLPHTPRAHTAPQRHSARPRQGELFEHPDQPGLFD